MSLDRRSDNPISKSDPRRVSFSLPRNKTKHEEEYLTQEICPQDNSIENKEDSEDELSYESSTSSEPLPEPVIPHKKKWKIKLPWKSKSQDSYELHSGVGHYYPDQLDEIEEEKEGENGTPLESNESPSNTESEEEDFDEGKENKSPVSDKKRPVSWFGNIGWGGHSSSMSKNRHDEYINSPSQVAKNDSREINFNKNHSRSYEHLDYGSSDEERDESSIRKRTKMKMNSQSEKSLTKSDKFRTETHSSDALTKSLGEDNKKFKKSVSESGLQHDKISIVENERITRIENAQRPSALSILFGKKNKKKELENKKERYFNNNSFEQNEDNEGDSPNLQDNFSMLRSKFLEDSIMHSPSMSYTSEEFLHSSPDVQSPKLQKSEKFRKGKSSSKLHKTTSEEYLDAGTTDPVLVKNKTGVKAENDLRNIEKMDSKRYKREFKSRNNSTYSKENIIHSPALSNSSEDILHSSPDVQSPKLQKSIKFRKGKSSSKLHKTTSEEYLDAGTTDPVLVKNKTEVKTETDNRNIEKMDSKRYKRESKSRNNSTHSKENIHSPALSNNSEEILNIIPSTSQIMESNQNKKSRRKTKTRKVHKDSSTERNQINVSFESDTSDKTPKRKKKTRRERSTPENYEFTSNFSASTENLFSGSVDIVKQSVQISGSFGEICNIRIRRRSYEEMINLLEEEMFKEDTECSFSDSEEAQEGLDDEEKSLGTTEEIPAPELVSDSHSTKDTKYLADSLETAFPVNQYYNSQNKAFDSKGIKIVKRPSTDPPPPPELLSCVTVESDFSSFKPKGDLLFNITEVTEEYEESKVFTVHKGVQTVPEINDDESWSNKVSWTNTTNITEQCNTSTEHLNHIKNPESRRTLNHKGELAEHVHGNVMPEHKSKMSNKLEPDIKLNESKNTRLLNRFQTFDQNSPPNSPYPIVHQSNKYKTSTLDRDFQKSALLKTHIPYSPKPEPRMPSPLLANADSLASGNLYSNKPTYIQNLSDEDPPQSKMNVKSASVVARNLLAKRNENKNISSDNADKYLVNLPIKNIKSLTSNKTTSTIPPPPPVFPPLDIDPFSIGGVEAKSSYFSKTSPTATSKLFHSRISNNNGQQDSLSKISVSPIKKEQPIYGNTKVGINCGKYGYQQSNTLHNPLEQQENISIPLNTAWNSDGTRRTNFQVDGNKTTEIQMPEYFPSSNWLASARSYTSAYKPRSPSFLPSATVSSSPSLSPTSSLHSLSSTSPLSQSKIKKKQFVTFHLPVPSIDSNEEEISPSPTNGMTDRSTKLHQINNENMENYNNRTETDHTTVIRPRSGTDHKPLCISLESEMSPPADNKSSLEKPRSRVGFVENHSMFDSMINVRNFDDLPSSSAILEKDKETEIIDRVTDERSNYRPNYNFIRASAPRPYSKLPLRSILRNPNLASHSTHPSTIPYFHTNVQYTQQSNKTDKPPNIGLTNEESKQPSLNNVSTNESKALFSDFVERIRIIDETSDTSNTSENDTDGGGASPDSLPPLPNYSPPPPRRFSTQQKDFLGGLLTSRGGLLTSTGGLLTSRKGLLTSRGGLLTSTGGLLTSTGGLLTSRLQRTTTHSQADPNDHQESIYQNVVHASLV